MEGTKDYDFYDFFIEECSEKEVSIETISTLKKIFKALRISSSVELKDNFNLLEATIDKYTVRIPLKYEKRSCILVEGSFCKHLYYSDIIVEGMENVILSPVILKIIGFWGLTGTDEIENKLVELLPGLDNTNYNLSI